MAAWTEQEWENLERLSKRLQFLLETRPKLQQNLALQTSLKITLENLSGYLYPTKF